MTPSWAVIADPERPATSIEHTTGPSSRMIDAEDVDDENVGDQAQLLGGKIALPRSEIRPAP
jgi:hypothetical protein